VRFLVDEQLPPALARWLGDRGHAAVHVRDVGLSTATDAAIWRFAVEGEFVIVSKDEDFVARRNRELGPAIVWLRLGNATRRVLIARAEQIWDDVVGWLERGETIVEA
jgi:predicted nuclease of predicted toxin-antitoxin system